MKLQVAVPEISQGAYPAKAQVEDQVTVLGAPPEAFLVKAQVAALKEVQVAVLINLVN
ncbi:MAG: hypothetical protein ABGZ19_03330 [Verrucomicrobiales bacterium]|nr:hypothetical protein [Verrucomicrobiales bacterium]